MIFKRSKRVKTIRPEIGPPMTKGDFSLENGIRRSDKNLLFRQHPSRRKGILLFLFFEPYATKIDLERK